MLSYCDALWLAPAGREAMMQKLAEAVGFRSAAPFGSTEPRGPICFYLVDQQVGDDEKRQFLARLRSSTDADVRLAPVIIIVGDSPSGTVFDYRRWGFDDIAVLTGDGPSLIESFAAHISQETVYYETASYLGPDRRRQGRAQPRKMDKPSIPIEHRFIRDPLEGTQLVNPSKSSAIYLAPRTEKAAGRPSRK